MDVPGWTLLRRAVGVAPSGLCTLPVLRITLQGESQEMNGRWSLNNLLLGKVIGVSLLVIAIVAIGGNILVHYHQAPDGIGALLGTLLIRRFHYRIVRLPGDPVTEIVVPVPAIGGHRSFPKRTSSG